MIRNAMNEAKVDMSDGSFQREFSMDKAEYDHIVEMAENDEFVDFEIPKDAPEGKRMSDVALGTESTGEQIPVDLNEVFGEKTF